MGSTIQAPLARIRVVPVHIANRVRLLSISLVSLELQLTRGLNIDSVALSWRTRSPLSSSLWHLRRPECFSLIDRCNAILCCLNVSE